MFTGKQLTQTAISIFFQVTLSAKMISGQYVVTKSKNNPINKQRKERRNAMSQSGSTQKQLSFNFY